MAVVSGRPVQATRIRRMVNAVGYHAASPPLAPLGLFLPFMSRLSGGYGCPASYRWRDAPAVVRTASTVSRPRTGFTAPLGKNKPRPLRLELTHKDVLRLGGKVFFTPARFNYSPDCTESSIVTSTGPFVITWDFAASVEARAFRERRALSCLLGGAGCMQLWLMHGPLIRRLDCVIPLA